MRRFPDGFRWGAATAAYQVEGAVAEDGRGVSIWDTFSHTPGAVLGGDTGDVACDHYHRYREDVALMAGIGVSDYRFSVAWPRVLPTGAGAVNQAGLDFYSRLVDELLAHGVRPLATLYHWDLPQTLQDAGGWTNRDTAERFAEYAGLVASCLGDRVPAFTTLNEPWCSAYLGHATGAHAPGGTDVRTAFVAAHHLMLAHGLGARAVRASAPAGVQVSITLNTALIRPLSPAPGDQRAAERADLLANRLFLDPLLLGSWPPQLFAETQALTDWSFAREGDLELINVPLDFLGVNYYTPTVVSDSPADPAAPAPFAGVDGVFEQPQPGPKTAMGWPVEAGGLTELLARLHRDYPGVAMVVTENGSAYRDEVGADGSVDDPERAAYLAAHIAAAGRAIEDGVDVRGYFVWSLLDNFEWAWGYSQRFGIVHVDFESQRRRLKSSGQLYRRIVAAHGLPTD
jgi:beta-glucosidase